VYQVYTAFLFFVYIALNYVIFVAQYDYIAGICIQKNLIIKGRSFSILPISKAMEALMIKWKLSIIAVLRREK